MLGPYELAGGVHGDGRLLAAQFDDNSAVVVTDSDPLLALLRGNAPSTLQAIVE